MRRDYAKRDILNQKKKGKGVYTPQLCEEGYIESKEKGKRRIYPSTLRFGVDNPSRLAAHSSRIPLYLTQMAQWPKYTLFRMMEVKFSHVNIFCLQLVWLDSKSS